MTGGIEKILFRVDEKIRIGLSVICFCNIPNNLKSRVLWKTKSFCSRFRSMPYTNREILHGRKSSPNYGTSDVRAGTRSDGPNLENLSGGAFMVGSNPCGNILDIRNRRRYHDESYPTTSQFHPRYHDFESTTAGFIQDVDLQCRSWFSSAIHLTPNARTSSTRKSFIWDSIPL